MCVGGGGVKWKTKAVLVRANGWGTGWKHGGWPRSIPRLMLMEGCWEGGVESMGRPASIPRWRLMDASVLGQAWGAGGMEVSGNLLQ